MTLPADLPATLLLPDALSPVVATALLALSLITSLITATFGAGGGLMLLAVLSIALPPAAIIPVHGMIQLGSNGARSLMVFRHIDWTAIRWFIPGMLAGAAVGSLVLVELPPPLFQLIIAGFVLYLCWGPPLPGATLGPAGITGMAAGTTFLSLFVGATGPLISAFLRQRYPQRFPMVATIATATFLQHLAKVAVFGLVGFAFAQWLPFIAAMIVSGTIGTRLGLTLLQRRSDERFARYFNLLLTLMALRLIWQAVADLRAYL